MAAKKRGLGRGLDALLGASTQPASAKLSSGDAVSQTETGNNALREIPVDVIQRGRFQPRRDFEPEALQELADSISVQGIMQPIVVRPVTAGEVKYEIIAGERRWRAAQLASLESVPAVIRDVPDEAAIAMALIENIQREDLNPMEEAVALSRLQQEFDFTQQEIATAVGKSRPAVANLLRLLALREDVKTLLERGDLEMGHARALLALQGVEQSQAARAVVGRGLSVRQTESFVRAMTESQGRNTVAKKIDPDIRKLQDDLSQTLGAKVIIQHTAKGKGKLVLNYSSLDELDGILSHIK